MILILYKLKKTVIIKEKKGMIRMDNQALDRRMQENLQMVSNLRLLDDDLMTLVFDKISKQRSYC